MSSEIIYHRVVHTIPAAQTGLTEDLFVVAAQIGSSNCYEYGKRGRDGRRSRSWSALAAGTKKATFERLISVAGAFEGGGIRMNSHMSYTKPESFIAGSRKMLNAANPYMGSYLYMDGVFALSFSTNKYWADDAKSVDNLVSWAQLPQVIDAMQNGGLENFIKVYGPDIRK